MAKARKKRVARATKTIKPKTPSSGMKRVEMAGMNALDMGGGAAGGGGTRRRRRRPVM